MSVTRTRPSPLYSTSQSEWKEVPPGDARRHGRGRRVDHVPQALVPDYWLDQQIGAWRVAYRLGVADGRCVISEVRLFPNEPDARRGGRRGRWDRGTTQPPGSWNGTWNGVRAHGIPAEGITAALLRQIPVGQAATIARRVAPQGLDPRDDAPLPVSVPEPPAADAPGPRRGRPPVWTRNDYRRIREWADAGLRAGAIAVRLGVLPTNASPEDQRRAAARVRTLLRRAIVKDAVDQNVSPPTRRRRRKR